MSSDSIFGNRSEFVFFRIGSECENQESTIGTESVMLHSTHVVAQNQIARRDHHHRFRLLVDHIRIRSDFLKDFSYLDVAVVNRSVPRVMKCCKDLHKRVIDNT